MTDLRVFNNRNKRIYKTIMYIYNDISTHESTILIEDTCEIDIEQTRDGWKEGLKITINITHEHK